MLSSDKKQTIISEYKQSEHDTGSCEVQIALLTKEIDQLTEHVKNFPKDFSAKRGLLGKVSQRRSHLSYLEKMDAKRYKNIIDRLGIRK